MDSGNETSSSRCVLDQGLSPARKVIDGTELAAPDSAKIMIVDDEPVTIKVARKHLEARGYTRFVTTGNPKQALDLIRQEQPDVIILDIMMPGIGGLTILEQIRHDSKLQFIPVIILTASTERGIRPRAQRLGATRFLAKPINSGELITEVRNALTSQTYQAHLRNHSECPKK